jgi:hypothetical protein
MIKESTGNGWARYCILLASLALVALGSLTVSGRADAAMKTFCYGANLPGYLTGCDGAYEYKNAAYATSGDGPPCLSVFDLLGCGKGSENGGWGVYITNGSQYGEWGKASIINLNSEPLKVYGTYWTAPAPPPPPPPPAPAPPPPSPPAWPEGKWFLRDSNTTGAANNEFFFGGPGLKFVVGDWNGDGIDTPGAYDPANGNWFLRNSNTTGSHDIHFTFGGCCDMMPIAGDWNGDGIDTIGLYKPSASPGQWFLRNSNTTGSANVEFTYGGGAGTVGLAGDWNNDGVDTIGMFKPNGSGGPSQWFLRNANSTGAANIEFTYGSGLDMLGIVGDWNNDGIDTPGLYKTNGEVYLRNSNSTGGHHILFGYGGFSNPIPLAGDWNKDGTDTIGLAR